MKPKSAGAAPEPRSDATLPLTEALSRSKPLARLADALRESDARYRAIQPLLPPALARHIRPGPLDERGWSLLAGNPAVAAKLRQLAPRLESALAANGFASVELRIKVSAG